VDYIEFLGSCGTRTQYCGPTCIKVSEHTLVDAGNIIAPLGEKSVEIYNIFLTHAHLDHIYDLPFLLESIVGSSTHPLKIYALKETIDVLRTFIFNNEVWPDFSRIKLLKGLGNAIEFVEISLGEYLDVDGIRVKAIKNNHTAGSCGYIIEKGNGAILISGDTYICDEIWDSVNRNKKIHSICIDVSFPSEFERLAKDSRHLTPKLLKEEIKKLKRKDISVYPVHLKPIFYDDISVEIRNFGLLQGRSKIISDGDRIFFDNDMDVSTSDKTGSISNILLEEISEASMALSNEKNIDVLLELILEKVKKLTRSDGGTLYLLNREKDALEFKVVQTDTLNIKMGGTNNPIEWKPLPLYTKNGEKNMHMAAVAAVFEDRVINIADVYTEKGYDFSGTKSFDSNTGYRSSSMLIVPLKSHENETIGVLQLINKKNRHGNTVLFNRLDEHVATILASQAAIVFTKQQFINDMEKLFESFLHSINVAIEDKSKYTAGHIHKMVSITMMLVDAVNRDRDVFKNISFSKEEIRQIKMAALMHDVGKIVIPEYVVDKATRLQTIYDRIGTIKAKKEIRKRDVIIKCLTGKRYSEVLFKTILSKDCAEELERIEREYRFLESINSESEYLSDEKIEELERVAKNTIDIDGGGSVPWIDGDELANLSIRRGTLTEKEREIINNHAMTGLKMLKQLPFPSGYTRIPEIAAAHHEKLNGTGYPLGLKESEIPLEARILAVADIFEALTASDRPYKKAMSLEKSMSILKEMANENELDKDIVDLLFKNDLYKKIFKTVSRGSEKTTL